jgi:hypothetical protein
MVAFISSTVYNRCVDYYESPQSVGTSKKGMELIMEVQPKDTSKGHFYVSLAKSFIRITAGITLVLAGTDTVLMPSWLTVAGGMFIVAELLGIVEEIV